MRFVKNTPKGIFIGIIAIVLGFFIFCITLIFTERTMFGGFYESVSGVGIVVMIIILTLSISGYLIIKRQKK